MDLSISLPHSQNPQRSSFMCNSCAINFPTADLQRYHMKTEWHRYNLKRRVAQLAPVSSDLFAEKFMLSQNKEYERDEDEYGFALYSKRRPRDQPRKQITKKELKRQEKLKLRGRNNLLIGLDEGQGVTRDLSPASVAGSEFSNFSLAESLQTNLESNDRESIGDTLSESRSVEDGSGLYDYSSDNEYVSEETTDDNEEEEDDDDDYDNDTADEDKLMPITTCFFCGDTNEGIEQNIDHMFKSHGLYIPERSNLKDVTGLLEFLSYIFSIDNECLICGFFGKSLESLRQHMVAKGHCKLPFETREDKEFFADFYDFNSSDNGDQEQSSLSNLNNLNNFAEDHSELVLANGSRVAHRSMMSHYNHRNSSSLVPRTEGQRTIAVSGRNFCGGLTLKEVNKLTKNQYLHQQKAKKAYEKRSAKYGNFQAHFRDDVFGTTS
ncbi:hypothetical protein PACTADRAFT_49539 [Pachysolen tannophilus NRRL Y-2460]|uniref:C2H2-type domain-containing protein n=1 Tax=Pachysolen tannophilus NRRL Y-2460 TaxID=669874 RepID=A0A1E4TWN2_PACTA|nr:hypothetical protein PACTADRAFT_49539 [Pachysolen tannophilus NRRL Y-2460]